jgi:hypothetical protein
MRPCWAVLALGLIAIPDLAAQEPDITIELRVLAHATLNRGELDRARETATALLATGGIQGSWRECTSGTCESAASGSPHSVTVLLLPIAKLNGDDICGEATRDALTRDPTVLVYVRSIVDRVRTIHRSSTGRSQPTLLTLQPGHLAGIAIAHEVGHALGLGHAPSGVMKAQLGIDDLLVWRRSGLAFSRIEAMSLRATVLSKSSGTSRVQ